MPPIRRYLRITRHSVLEVRIYLDNPADAQRWLLSPRDPVLPRVIAAVRPLVLPKLREENQLAAKKGKGGKKKGWKDVVVEDEFEVSIFLTETSTRHSILRKTKHAKDSPSRLGSPNGKITGTMNEPVLVEEGVGIVREESNDDQPPLRMEDVPTAAGEGSSVHEEEKEGEDEEEEDLFVSSPSPEPVAANRKRKQRDADNDPKTTPKPDSTTIATANDENPDEKKKMFLETEYDGFSIYGRILCLVVKRRGGAKGAQSGGGNVMGSGQGQAMMEGWIASTQVGQEAG